MHILFLVDPLAAPLVHRGQTADEASPNNWSSNAFVRLMMRLSLLTTNISSRPNECAVKFLSVQDSQVLNHLEFARRFQHDWTLNGDFFEPWTQEHFDTLVKELSV